MIQSTPAAASPACIMPGDGTASPAKTGTEGADFGAFLAVQAGDASLPGGSAVLAVPAVPTQPDLTAIPAEPAIPGNILPPGLPVVAVANAKADPVSDPDTIPAPKPHGGKSRSGHPHPVMERIKPDAVNPAGALRDEPVDAAEAALPEPVADAKPPVSEPIAVKPVEPVPVSEVLAVKLPDPAPLAIPKPEAIPVSEPLTAKPKGDLPDQAPSKAQGPAHRTIPDLPASASDQARAQLERHRAQAPATPTADFPVAPVLAELVGPAQKPGTPVMRPALDGTKAATPDPAAPLPQPVTPTPLPAEAVRLAINLPRVAMARMARDEARIPVEAELLASDQVAITSATPSQQPAAPNFAASPVSQVRPHDFGALIERLSAAREALAPQAVSITLAHQEFGPVRLQFRSEDTGLSVAMSSADPDFARAAAAQPAPVLPTTASEQAGSALQQRGEGATSQHGSFAQSRGQSSERRENHQQSQSHPSPPPRGSGRGSAPRSGIFA